MNIILPNYRPWGIVQPIDRRRNEQKEEIYAHSAYEHNTKNIAAIRKAEKRFTNPFNPKSIVIYIVECFV